MAPTDACATACRTTRAAYHVAWVRDDDIRLKRSARMLHERGAEQRVRANARALPVRMPGSGVQRPFVSSGRCRYRTIVRRSRPARNCHFVMRVRLWFLCKRLQDPIA